MKTLSNESGSKIVSIKKDGSSFLCMYIQVYKGEEQVLDTKRCARENTAIKWGKSQLA